MWRGSAVPEIALVTNGALMAGKEAPRLEFNRTAPRKPVDFAVFAAKHGAVERAFVLVRLQRTKPKNCW